MKIILAQERSRLEARLQEIIDRRNDPDNPDPNYGFFDRFSLDDAIVSSGDINITGTLKGGGTLKSPKRLHDPDPERVIAHLELGDLESPRPRRQYAEQPVDLRHHAYRSGRNLGSRVIVENP